MDAIIHHANREYEAFWTMKVHSPHCGLKERFLLWYETFREGMYRERLKGMQILQSGTQAGPGRTGKQEQEEISPNHVQTF